MACTTHVLQALFIILGIHSNPYLCFELNKLTEDQVEKMSNWKPEDNQGLWELSGQFEGDMVMDTDDTNAISAIAYWPKNTIPIEIDPVFNAKERKIIIESTKKFERVSCFKVRPRIATDAGYVYISANNTGCWAHLGYQSGRQYVNLQKQFPNPQTTCVHEGVIIHEFMHSMGFPHQQSTWNRDQHVDILWDNIPEDKKYNFETTWRFYTVQDGLPYDYYSIMHYSRSAFSRNNEETIRPKVSGVKLGYNTKMTKIDIAKLNKLCKLSENEVPRTIQSRTYTQLYESSPGLTGYIFNSTSRTSIRNRISINASGAIQIVNYLTVVISICMIFLCNMLI